MEKYQYGISDRDLTSSWKLRDALDSGNSVCAATDTRCSIVREGDQYVMTGPKGRHAINADRNATNDERLWAHWTGFKSNNHAVQS